MVQMPMNPGPWPLGPGQMDWGIPMSPGPLPTGPHQMDWGMPGPQALEWLLQVSIDAVMPMMLLAPPAIPVHRPEELIQRIERFMQEQATATLFYAELEALAPQGRIRDQIRHAREDEQKHYRMLGELYQALTGRAYEAQPERVVYNDLTDGLLIAFEDELKGFADYRNTYLEQPAEPIRQLFFELMTDEHEHATRFTLALYLLDKVK